MLYTQNNFISASFSSHLQSSGRQLNCSGLTAPLGGWPRKCKAQNLSYPLLPSPLGRRMKRRGLRQVIWLFLCRSLIMSQTTYFSHQHFSTFPFSLLTPLYFISDPNTALMIMPLYSMGKSYFLK